MYAYMNVCMYVRGCVFKNKVLPVYKISAFAFYRIR